MKILGHRGIVADGNAPFQNTLAAFEYALKYGDGLETDACISKDGEIFLIHEKSSGGHYSIAPYLTDESAHKLGKHQLADITADEIKQLKLINGNPIPTLHEVMHLYTGKPDKVLNIELKSYGVEKYIVPHLEKAFKEGIIEPEQLVISSFNHKAVAYLQDKIPDVKFGALFTDLPKEDGDAIYPWLEKSPQYRGVTEKNIAACVDVFDYLVVPARQVTRDLMATMPEGKVIPWVSSGDEAFSLHDFTLTIGTYKSLIDAIIVNNPKDKP